MICLLTLISDHSIDQNIRYFHERYHFPAIQIEIKASQTFNKECLKNLLFFQNLAGERSEKGYLIYSGSHEQSIGKIQALNYQHTVQTLVSL